MPFAELPTGARLHYVDTGAPGGMEAIPVVVVHGFLGTAERDLGSVIDWLREDYRVLGPTLRGYGQSTPGPRDFPFDFYQRDARDVLAFIDTLGIEQAHILGYSDGGETALLAAAMEPDRFRAVIAWGAVGYYGPAMRPVVQRMFPADWITAEEKTLHGIDNANAFVLSWMKAVKHIIDTGGDLSLSKADQISAPLLLLLGERDHLNPIEYGQRLVDRAPNGRLVTFDTGHGIHDEAWGEFRRVVGGFLKNAGH